MHAADRQRMLDAGKSIYDSERKVSVPLSEDDFLDSMMNDLSNFPPGWPDDVSPPVIIDRINPVVDRFKLDFDDEGEPPGPQTGPETDPKTGPATVGRRQELLRRVLPAAETLVKRDPENPEARDIYGRFLYHSGDDDEKAFENINRAIELGRKSPENYYMRGAVAERLGDYRQANLDAARVLAMKPAYKPAHSLFKLTRNQVDSSKRDLSKDKALMASAGPGALLGKLMTPGAGTPPGASGTRISHEEALRRARADAVRTVTPAKRSAAKAKEASRALAVGDFKAAAKKAEEAVKIDPRNVDAYAVGSWANVYQEKYPETVRTATKGLRLNPRHVRMLNARSLAYNRTKRYQPALTDASLAATLNPRSALAYFNKGYAWSGLGRKDNSLRELRRGAALDPKIAKIYEKASALPSESDLLALFDGPLFGRPAALAKSGLALWKKAVMGLGAALLVFGIFFAMRRDGATTAATGATPVPEGGGSGAATRSCARSRPEGWESSTRRSTAASIARSPSRRCSTPSETTPPPGSDFSRRRASWPSCAIRASSRSMRSRPTAATPI